MCRALRASGLRTSQTFLTRRWNCCGEVYLPFLHANAAAANAGEDRFAVTLMGQPYAQAPFGYQVKCLDWLREELAGLDDEARARIRPVLEETGCWNLLTD